MHTNTTYSSTYSSTNQHPLTSHTTYTSFSTFSEDGGEEEEEVLDIDLGDAFDKLSKGKNYITLKAFMRWDLVSNLLADGYLRQSDVDDVFKMVNEGEKEMDLDRIDVDTFEAVVTELVSRVQEYDDEDDEDGKKCVYIVCLI